MFTNNEIARYYDLSEVHYRYFWNLDQSKSLHYGYWDASTKNFHEALLNINKILAQLAGIEKDSIVLDAGCGIGGSSLWMGSRIGCSVTGISLSQKQVDKANLLAQKEKLEKIVHFEQQDFTKTNFPDNHFDVVWAIESVCHATDKSDFLKEAYRILKKGGRLVMADFFKKEGLTGKDAEIIQQWAHGWAVPDFSTIEEFNEKLTKEGFSEVKIENATTAIMPSAKKLYKAYFLGIAGAKLYKLFNPKATDVGRSNVETARLQYVSLKKELWTYQIVRAVKE